MNYWFAEGNEGKNLRIVVMVMVRVVLRGVPVGPVVLVVFDGGPKSHGDELIVRTSRFFAEPESGRRRKHMKNEVGKMKIHILKWDNFLWL